MKYRSTTFWDGFFAGIFFGTAAVWLFNDQQENRKRIESLRKRLVLNNGFEEDRRNLEGDWRSVNEGLYTTFEQLKKNIKQYESTKAF